jgi:hypothetical protein
MKTALAEAAEIPRNSVLAVRWTLRLPKWLISTLQIIGFLAVFCTATGLVEILL